MSATSPTSRFATDTGETPRLDRRARPTAALERVPAVSLAIAKRAGANAVVIAEEILHRRRAAARQADPRRRRRSTVTRNYGETANEKANELLFHLGLATISIIVLVAVAIGWREALVVAIVIPITILLTLFASWLMGYTLNRVSLFALIFSIGILVDDAIVVIENIARHWAHGRRPRPRAQAAIEAVAEVGNPTIVATLTVVAALLPMLFVSGMMGPYMSPIPANASAAMIFSFFVAVIRDAVADAEDRRPRARRAATTPTRTAARSAASTSPSPARSCARKARELDCSCWSSASLTLGSLALFYTKHVTVKLLPFDNKSELQVVVDLPEGSSVEDTDRVLQAVARTVLAAARGRLGPDLCRHRRALQLQRPRPPLLPARQPEQGDVAGQPHAEGRARPRQPRHRARHPRAARRLCRAAPAPASRWSSRRPGRRCSRRCSPRSTAPTPRRAARSPPRSREAFASGALHRRRRRFLRHAGPRGCASTIDQDNLEFFQRRGARRLRHASRILNGGETVGYSHRGGGRQPIPIRVERAKGDRDARRALPDHADPGQRAARRPRRGRARRRRPRRRGARLLPDLPPQRPRRRDGDRPSSPAPSRRRSTACSRSRDAIDAADWTGLPKPAIALHGQPDDESTPTLLWDGEWEVTWVTFRDMGARLHAWRSSASTSWSSPSSARSSCRWSS